MQVLMQVLMALTDWPQNQLPSGRLFALGQTASPIIVNPGYKTPIFSMMAIIHASLL